jgi:hypothetical protein
MDKETYELLAATSVRDGKQRYNEAQIRSMVGTPSIEEENTCTCGVNINECDDTYSHMTQGV